MFVRKMHSIGRPVDRWTMSTMTLITKVEKASLLYSTIP